MKTSTKPLMFALFAGIFLFPMQSLIAQLSGEVECYLDAGEDIELQAPAPIHLQANAVNIAEPRWGTYGDGYFIDEYNVSTFYVPGDADIDNGEVTLYIGHGQPAFPNDDFVDYYTIKSGDWNDGNIWNTGVAPSQNINNKVIVLRHNVIVKQGIIKLNQGAKLYADNVTFMMYPNRSFVIQDGEVVFAGGKFVQLDRIFGSPQGGNSAQGDLLLTKASSKLRMIGTDVWISGNFHNNGTRILENVSLKVDRHYHNNGTDILKNVCAQIAYQQQTFGNGPGNIINSASATLMRLENTTMYTYNGNMVNNSVIEGHFSALRIEEGNLVNNGEWNASIDLFCVDRNVNGTYSVDLPGMDCLSADEAVAGCVTDECASAYDELKVYINLPEDTTDVDEDDPNTDIGGAGGDSDNDDGGPVKGGGGGPTWPLVTGSGKFVPGTPGAYMEIYPNPLKAGKLLNISTDLESPAVVRITGVDGKIYFDEYADINAPFEVPGNLAPGVYFILIDDTERQAFSRMAIVE